MGLRAACNEGHVVVADGDKIIKTWFMADWKQMREDLVKAAGGHYVKGCVSRMLFTDAATEKLRKACRPAVTESSSQIEGTEESNVLRLYFRFAAYFTKTLDEIDEQFKTRQAGWKESEQHKLCVTRLLDMKTSGVHVTNIVTLGVESLHQAIGDGRSSGDDDRGAMLQLAAIVTFRELLGEPAKLLPCTLQDPAYSKLDRQYLNSLDFNVVDDPDGFSLITESTLVFHCNCETSVAWWITQCPKPVAMVCNEHWCSDPELLSADRPEYCVPDIRKMFLEYEGLKFMESGAHEDDRNLKLYLRKSAEKTIIAAEI